MRCSAYVFLFAALFSSAAAAAQLEVSVRTNAGTPIPNAVVTVYPASGDSAPRPAAEPLTIEQKNIAFAPYVLIVPAGSLVAFPNRDTVRHHVYSFSAPHRFELKLYGRQERPAERFDKAGVVALGCNIHDSMAAYIDVVDTRFAGKTDAEGVVRLDGLPAGAAVIKVWHPASKAAGGMVNRALTVGASTSTITVALDVRPSSPGKQDR